MGIQDAVLAHAPIDAGFSLNQPREPEYLDKARKGLCYDRSRAIEKTLTLMGFEVRHAAIYSTAKTGSALKDYGDSNRNVKGRIVSVTVTVMQFFL